MPEVKETKEKLVLGPLKIDMQYSVQDSGKPVYPYSPKAEERILFEHYLGPHILGVFFAEVGRDKYKSVLPSERMPPYMRTFVLRHEDGHFDRHLSGKPQVEDEIDKEVGYNMMAGHSYRN